MSLDPLADLAQVAHVATTALLVFGAAAISRYLRIRRSGQHSRSAYRGRHIGPNSRSDYHGRHRGSWYAGWGRNPGYAGVTEQPNRPGKLAQVPAPARVCA